MTKPSWHGWALEGQKEPTVKFEKTSSITPDIQRLLDKSTKDKFLGDIVKHKKLDGLVVFWYDNEAVGFAIPRKESDGHYRTGPIFVEPGFRNKGIAKRFVKEYFADKKGRAYIDGNNMASQVIYKQSGFVRTGKSMMDDGEKLYEYVKQSVAVEAVHEKPLAVIVKGNPKYLNNHKVRPQAEKFYADVKARLEERGYRVEFDGGEPYTSPNETAKVWVGHSRGIDRLDHAPKSIKTLALQTQDHNKTFENNDEHGVDPSHYLLSDQDKKALSSI